MSRGAEQPALCQEVPSTCSFPDPDLQLCHTDCHGTSSGMGLVSSVVLCLPSSKPKTVQLQLNWDLEASHKLHNS